MRDLSSLPGNPTHDLQAAYPTLMAIEDARTLHDEAVRIVVGRVGNGVSARNATTFQQQARKLRDSLPKLRSYVTNFVLKGAGLGVIS